MGVATQQVQSTCSGNNTHSLFGADEGTRTHMVSHRNLKPARLPVSPRPLILNARYYNTTFFNCQAFFPIPKKNFYKTTFCNFPSPPSNKYTFPPEESVPTICSSSINNAALSSMPYALENCVFTISSN